MAGILMRQAVNTGRQAATEHASGCAEIDEVCKVRAAVIEKRYANEALLEMARLAQQSRDPDVVSHLVRVCRLDSDLESNPACLPFTWRAWAQSDPGNAAPWLFMAHDASGAKDWALADEAYFQAAHAKTNNVRFDALLLALARPELDPLSSPESALALQHLLQIHAMLPLPRYSRLYEYCKAAGVEGNPNRRQTCLGLMALLTQRSTLLVDFSMGRGLARHLGLSPQRLRELEDEHLAMHAVASTQESQSQPFSCESLSASRVSLLERATRGELQALQLMVVASGQSKAELASQWRSLLKAAASAASR